MVGMAPPNPFATDAEQELFEEKRARVDEPHVAPLNQLVRRWRALPGADAPRFIPWFDPDGAGVAARVLAIMESPGPQTVAAGDLGFNTEDNPNPASRIFARLRREAGLPRSLYLRWNIVPWALHDAQGLRRGPRTADVVEGAPFLDQLLAELPELRIIVTFGQPALTGVMRHFTLRPLDRVLPILGVPHPSPRATHDRPELLLRITNALATARNLAVD